MKRKATKWAAFVVRWGIAIAGIYWVLSKTPFTDQLMLVDPVNQLIHVQALNEPSEDAARFETYNRTTGVTQTIPRDDVWTKGDGSVVLADRTRDGKAKVLAIRPGIHYVANEPPAELLIKDPKSGLPVRIKPSDVVGGYRVRVAYPLVDVGVMRLVRHANPWFLVAWLAVLPFNYLVTSRRWHMLLEALDIHISQTRTFVLNMVGCFYNSFMPGSTGGDLIRAWYAAQHTTHRVRAVLSVIVDRVTGLLALIMLGGVMAATQRAVPECRVVAIACAGLILATLVGTVVFYIPTLRRATGITWIAARLPMQRQLHHVLEAMDLYGKRVGTVMASIAMSVPVHMCAVLSTMLACIAFGIKMPTFYYFVIVPVIVLVSAIPISPQGAGVMEVFAVLLTKNQGVTVSQAIALAMALRFGQIFWNLVAGLFVLRGGYHAPTEAEQETLETDEDEGPAAQA